MNEIKSAEMLSYSKYSFVNFSFSVMPISAFIYIENANFENEHCLNDR